MADVSFNAGLDVRNQAAGRAIALDHLVAIEVTSMVVDTRDFVSGDLTRRREGIVQLDVCGQPTAFPFAGSGVIPIPADTRLVYFGTRPRGLSLQVRLIEDDEGEWDALRHVEAFLGGAAGLPASLVTAAGKAGAGLAAAFVQFLRTRIRNHDEAIVYTTLDDGLHDGQNVALRFPREGRPRLTANLRILDLGVRGKAQSVAVRVATPRLSFTDQPIVESQRAPAPAAAPPSGATRYGGG